MTIVLEITGFILNMLYVILAARQNIWCWFFGIAGSAVSIYLFVNAKLYAESILFVYYIIMGIYGWYKWSQPKDPRAGTGKIIAWRWKKHVIILLAGSLSSMVLAYILQEFTEAEMSLLDSFTTVFSFIATWMTARKLISNWIYWIIIDAATIYLYFSRSLYVYALLSLIYTGMAVYGYIAWLKNYRAQEISDGK